MLRERPDELHYACRLSPYRDECTAADLTDPTVMMSAPVSTPPQARTAVPVRVLRLLAVTANLVHRPRRPGSQRFLLADDY